MEGTFEDGDGSEENAMIGVLYVIERPEGGRHACVTHVTFRR
ncbi:hypothetical protein [Streptomyces sp. NPDC096152]